jgi:hypothetical protein
MKQGRKTIPPEEFLRVCQVFGHEGQSDATIDGKNLRDVAEERRQEGLHIAQCLTGLDEAFDWFKGDEKVVFARY